MKKIIIEPELLTSLYWGENYSINQIKNLFHCSKNTILKLMKSHNIDRRDREDGIKLMKEIGYHKGQIPWNKGRKISHKESCNCVCCLSKRHCVPQEIIDKRTQRARESSIRNGSQKKENNPSWKGGITEQASLERKTKEWKDWRKQVFERDNYTCQSCGKRGCVIHPHHIKKRSVFPELKFDINNGVTLCNRCHIKLHSLDWLK